MHYALTTAIETNAKTIRGQAIFPRRDLRWRAGNDRLFLSHSSCVGLGRGRTCCLFVVAQSGQYEDLEGAAERILCNEDDKPIVSGRQPNSLPETGDKSVKN